MTDRNWQDPVYKGNDVARDFGAEVRSHEVGERMWNIYVDKKNQLHEEINGNSPRDLILDAFRIFSYDDLKALKIREESDIEVIIASHDFFSSVLPKDISGERKTTKETSNFPEADDLDPETSQSIHFLRNVFSVFVAFANNSITEEINAQIIGDRRSTIKRLLEVDAAKNPSETPAAK